MPINERTLSKKVAAAYSATHGPGTVPEKGKGFGMLSQYKVPIIKAIEGLGFEIVSKSTYSAIVLKHKRWPKQVIKIFFADPTFAQWVSFCRKNKAVLGPALGKHLPVYYTDATHLISDFWFVRMEELIPCEKSWINSMDIGGSSSKTFEALLDAIRNSRFDLDLHSGNVMMRATGTARTFVLIDPFHPRNRDVDLEDLGKAFAEASTAIRSGAVQSLIKT